MAWTNLIDAKPTDGQLCWVRLDYARWTTPPFQATWTDSDQTWLCDDFPDLTVPWFVATRYAVI